MTLLTGFSLCFNLRTRTVTEDSDVSASDWIYMSVGEQAFALSLFFLILARVYIHCLTPTCSKLIGAATQVQHGDFRHFISRLPFYFLPLEGVEGVTIARLLKQVLDLVFLRLCQGLLLQVLHHPL